MSHPLLIEHRDGVDWVTLNRPESLNAVDPSLIDALNAYFVGLYRNRGTRVVVLKGAGANFCAGLDLKHAVQRRANVHGFVEHEVQRHTRRERGLHGRQGRLDA